MEDDKANEGELVFETAPLKRLQYRVNEEPPLYLCVFFGLQQSLLSLSKSLTVCILVAELVCSEKDEELKIQLFASTMVMSGVATFLQCTIGIRLPLYQGPSAAYVVPLLSLAELPEWNCQDINFALNGTDVSANDTLEFHRENVIIPKIQLLSGSLLLAGVLHSIVGITGLVGIILRFIGPITVVPAIMLIGIFMVKAVVKFVSTHWGVGIMTTTIGLVLSMYLGRYNTLIPFWSKRRGFHFIRYPLHKVFSILIAIIVGWVVSFILTGAGVFTNDKTSHQYLARTDARSSAVRDFAWFTFPYPGQFGLPSLSVDVFVSFIIATLLSVIDSIGDYYACAKVCQEPAPPSHAVNRGILVEGLASALSGAVGIGHSTSTIGGNIGAIGVTRIRYTYFSLHEIVRNKVASRRVFQAVGLLYIIFGVVSKIGAFFISIPYSVLGGVQILNFGILIGVVLSNLSYVDLNSTRNAAILGLSLLLGMMIPYWIRENPNAVPTGIEQVDNVVRGLLSNPAVIGGTVACFLDNTCPGTRKERGLVGWQVDVVEDEDSDTGHVTTNTDDEEHHTTSSDVYGLPFLPKSFQEWRWCQWLPFCPGYRQSQSLNLCKKRVN